MCACLAMCLFFELLLLEEFREWLPDGVVRGGLGLRHRRFHFERELCCSLVFVVMSQLHCGHCFYDLG
jgi:hypothetical protein